MGYGHGRGQDMNVSKAVRDERVFKKMKKEAHRKRFENTHLDGDDESHGGESFRRKHES